MAVAKMPAASVTADITFPSYRGIVADLKAVVHAVEGKIREVSRSVIGTILMPVIFVYVIGAGADN